MHRPSTIWRCCTSKASTPIRALQPPQR
jgi:hypothetical protein